MEARPRPGEQPPLTRLPTAREYADLPSVDKRRALEQLRQIRIAWLATEAPDYERSPA